MSCGIGWKEKFISLYMSNELADFKAALDMKRENMPRVLYRYRTINSGVAFARLLQTLCDGRLYCSHRDSLNDPFELRTPLSSRRASSYFGTNKSKASLYLEQLKKHFDDSEFEEVMQGDDWYVKLQRLMFREQSERSGKTVEFVENAWNEVLMKHIEDLSAAYESIFNMNRVASFSEDCTSLPMWQHYSDSHKGVCLAYDTEKLSIVGSNPIFPVLYATELPDAVKFSFEKLSMSDKPPFGLTIYHCIHKLVDWSYEKEWRYIFQPGSRYFSHEDVPQDYWDNGTLVDFIKPSKIILGNSIEAEVKSELLEAAKEHGISVTQMKKTPYGLEESHIDNVDL